MPYIFNQACDAALAGLQNNDPNFTKTLKKAVKDVDRIDGNCINGNLIGGLLTRPLFEGLNDPCIVPDFGHDPNCKCDNKEERGVLRLFGLQFAIDGLPNAEDVFGTYKISEDTQIEVLGITINPNYETANGEELERIGLTIKGRFERVL